MHRPGAPTRASAGGQRVTAGTAWLSAAERGSLLGMYFIVWCHRIFGRRLCALLIVPVVGYFFVTGRAARRASRGYLARLHRWAEGRGGDTREFEMVVHGREHLERLVDAGRGALVLSAHLGSFDALRVVADEGGVPLNVAMFLRNARMINAVFARLNPSRPLRIIDLERAAPHSVFEIRACLQRGEFVGMLADRVGVGDGARVSWVTFFGERAAIPQGPFLLASALKCPVILMIGLRIDHRRYEVFVETLSDEVPSAPDALARHYVSRLEHYCLRAPYQWFNFYEFWDGP